MFAGGRRPPNHDLLHDSGGIVAEMWAVITCLEGARDGGFKQLHSQIDSAVTVVMLQDEVCASIP